MSLLAGSAQAGIFAAAATVLIGSAAMAQTNGPAPAAGDSRQQSDDLLRRSRAAMAQNDFDAAAALLGQADALGAQYPAIWLGDTPSRARRDLERMRSDAAGGSSMPSRLFAPFSSRKPAPTDPFLNQTPAVANQPPQNQAAPPQFGPNNAENAPQGPAGPMPPQADAWRHRPQRRRTTSGNE